MRLWVRSLASLRGLRIRHCRELWCRSQTRLGSGMAVAVAGSCRIGFAIARRLAQDGAHVVISSRKQENVEQAVATLRGEGLRVTGTVCHMGKAEDRDRLVATVLESCGGVDILVCAPAVNPLVGGVLKSSEQVWDKVREKKEHKELGNIFKNTKFDGKPEDCAGLVSFLCSSDASYINGMNIVVAGFSPSM
uniref:Dehydrogenase/reductase 2 n=1 Tax=Catagonus wagneri TaxID=51154 RepID=A0A8C3XBY8_9CETA